MKPQLLILQKHSVKQETNDWSMKYLKLAQFNEFLPQISFNARYSKAMGN